MKKYELSNQVERLLSESFNPIQKIFFILRRNFLYQLKLIELAEEKNDESILEILADLFSNRFYENILIQNAENEEFIILLFHLLKQEIESMHNASLASFLDEESKFIGKLLRVYTGRSEFKSFLKMMFNEFIIKIQNQHPNIEIDSKIIFNYIKTKYSSLQAISQNINTINSSSNGKGHNNHLSERNTISNIIQNNNPNNSEKNLLINKYSNTYDSYIIDSDNLGKAIKRSTLPAYVRKN